MDPFNLNVETLSKETFDLANEIKDVYSFDDQLILKFTEERDISNRSLSTKKNQLSVELSEPEDFVPISISDYNEGPRSEGIIYWILEKDNTFSLYGIATTNIYETKTLLEEDFESILSPSKHSTYLNANEIYFLETGCLALAEMVSDQMLNRRFPYKENQVFNFSDPGVNWWLKDSGDNFEVFFNSQRAIGRDNLICLGPIGDSNIANYRFDNSKESIVNAFGPKDLYCKGQSILVKGSAKGYLLKNLFMNGILDIDLTDFGLSTKSKTLFYYFKELALARKLWIDVIEKVGLRYSSS